MAQEIKMSAAGLKAMQEELDAQRAKFKKGSERKFRFDGGTR